MELFSIRIQRTFQLVSTRNWRMVAEGTRMTQDFASFLKELY